MKPPLQLRDEGRVFDVLGKGVSPDDVAVLDVQLQHLHVVDSQHLVQNRLGFSHLSHTHLVLLQDVQLRVRLEQGEIHVSTREQRQGH